MTDIKQRIDTLVESNEVVLFMKGNRNFPQCGFSATVVQILDGILDGYHTVNVLEDPGIRQGIKDYSSWPTIPQLYVRGEFVGGCDIVREMSASGELLQKLNVELGEVATPTITITDSAASQLKAALEDATGEVVHLKVSKGFEHAMELGLKGQSDVVATSNGIDVHIDPMSAPRAEGLSIDFIDGPAGGGFKIDNPNAPAKVIEITPAELKPRFEAGEFQLYDVRTQKERDTAQIAGSILLDDAVRAELEKLPKDTPLAFHCHHGGRSASAAEHFRNLGFKTVYNLKGGIDAWSQQVDPQIPRY